MNILYYLRSLSEIIVNQKSSKNYYDVKVEYINFFELRYIKEERLFFDIDDTLNLNKKGLNQMICRSLNEVAAHKSIVLITNCSKYRRRMHQSILKKYRCKAEIWAVGKKPNYRWIRSQIDDRGWELNECAMFGDRPTMDLWFARRAGFSKVIWVTGFANSRKIDSLVDYIRLFERKLMK